MTQLLMVFEYLMKVVFRSHENKEGSSETERSPRHAWETRGDGVLRHTLRT